MLKAVIKSAVEMAYEHAQDILEHPKKIWLKDELPPILVSASPEQGSLHFDAKKIN